jgi:N-ethylmaleimide reductase
LPNQFLVDGANKRTDEYGGSVENRSRFVIDIMRALIDVWGAQSVGIKLSPTIPFNNAVDSDPVALYSYLIEQLNTMEVGYVHLMQSLFPTDDFANWPKDPLATFGPMIKRPLITNGGYTKEKAERILNADQADLVSFGTDFVANPDLPYRFEVGAELAQPNRDTLYGGEDEGFIDYPALNEKAQVE